MPEYFRGLEKGLSILTGMRDYEVDTDIPGMEKYLKTVLDLIIADFTEHIEQEKAEVLKEMGDRR